MFRREFITNTTAWISSLFGLTPKKSIDYEELQPLEFKRWPLIRIWTIGNIEKGIKPTQEAISRLGEILGNRNEKEDLEIIWTEDLKCTVIQGGLDSIDVIETSDGNRHIIIKGYDQHPELIHKAFAQID